MLSHGLATMAWYNLLLCCALLVGIPESSAVYYFPNGHGGVNHEGYTPLVGPTNLNASFSWSWHHPAGKYHTLPYGTSIDDEKNIYLTTDTSIWKLNDKGKAIWSFYPPKRPSGLFSSSHATVYSAGCLWDGRMHFTTLDGRIWAISMETGHKIWVRKVCDSMNYDNGFVTAQDGVVFAATDVGPTIIESMGGATSANLVVRAVNSTSGHTLWKYKPERPIWNFKASFPGDGTVLYQDIEGRAYRHRISDGELLWKAGGHPGSWTDGIPMMGRNGLFYTVSAFMDSKHSPYGYLTAFNLDGAQVFKSEVPMPPNDAPALGHLPGHAGLSVIQPGGWQGEKGGKTGIFAFDAATGEKRNWQFIGPSQADYNQAGALEGMLERALAGATAGYVTNPWSAAMIDAAGTVYAGHEDGLIFALRDTNNDGEVKGDDEVSTYDTGAAFSGSSSPAFAPGLMAIASCDSLYVFKFGEPLRTFIM